MKATAKKHYQDGKTKIQSLRNQAVTLMGSKCHLCEFSDPAKLLFQCQLPGKQGLTKKTLGQRKVDWSVILDNPTSYDRYYKLVCPNHS